MGCSFWLFGSLVVTANIVPSLLDCYVSLPWVTAYAFLHYLFFINFTFITPSYSDEAGPRVFSSFDSVIYVAHKILGYQTYEHQYFCSFRRSSSYSTFWHDWERRAATERRSEGAYLFSALYIGMWINHARAPPGRGPHPPEFGIMGLFQTHQSPLSCKSSASTLRKTQIKTRFDQKRFCLKQSFGVWFLHARCSEARAFIPKQRSEKQAASCDFFHWIQDFLFRNAKFWDREKHLSTLQWLFLDLEILFHLW